MSALPPSSHSRSSRARGVIPLPETDVLGRELMPDSALRELPLESIRPDPNQGRWILPPDIRAQYHSGDLSPVEALQTWRARCQGNGDKHRQSPEGTKLSEIEALAHSIRTGGQINPITVVRQDGTWRIETGERRFWAHVWLVSVEGEEDAARIPALVRKELDPYRQAAENLHSAPLNAVSTARTVARLLHHATGIPAPGQEFSAPFDWTFYRAVASARVPHGTWPLIEEAMGRSADHLARHLRILLLPPDALEIADRADLTEKQLRPVTEVRDGAKQIQVVKLAAELSLPSPEIERLCRAGNLDRAEQELRARLAGTLTAPDPRAKYAPEQVLFKRVSGLARLARSVERGGRRPAEALAEEYSEQRADSARAELESLVTLLQEALGLIGASGS